MAWKENPWKWRVLIYCSFLAMGAVVHALELMGHGQRCPIPIPALGSCPAEYCHSRGPMIVGNGLPMDMHSALSSAGSATMGVGAVSTWGAGDLNLREELLEDPFPPACIWPKPNSCWAAWRCLSPLPWAAQGQAGGMEGSPCLCIQRVQGTP